MEKENGLHKKQRFICVANNFEAGPLLVHLKSLQSVLL